MKQTQFSSFGRFENVRVSRLGFGAMGLAQGTFGRFEEKALVEAVLHSLESGINLVDTARLYGDSEALIGKALREWRGERPFLATKVQPHANGWGRPVEVMEAYPPGSLSESVETSLVQLGVEAIDLVQMHQYWPLWDYSDYWMDELLQLKEQGKIRFIGISVPDHRHDMALHLIQSGAIDSVQSILNVFDPIALDNLVPLCRKLGVAFIARCVLDEGGLTGFLTLESEFAGDDFRNGYFDAGPREEYIRRTERLKSFVPQHAGSLAELALRFALQDPGVTTAVVSMHVKQHADSNMAALNAGPLPADVFEELRYHHRWVRNLYEHKYW
ncbi:aldo/keto reductase [Cohnella silvisoli]|uniref:Aldo/keto reductase n=1 Tax=Cohnella silvisoli TaxID=2873699 RepID=A0ABV1KLZ0_9BACL|nr:aldo/keto reductase [Cohnella silvisoli]MCD9020816.1 aldo/keto reductase [Cohnella silvisoli]